MGEPMIPWRHITGPGQVKPGDLMRFSLKGRRIEAPAQVVLHEGTDREEIIYNRKRNHYFITSMAVDGTSNHKDVMFVQMKPHQGRGGGE